MKALSVKQPWAWLIASGKKTIETRIWPTNYRGPILIVASKAKISRVEFSAFRAVFIDCPVTMWYGFAVCKANLVDCRKMTKDDQSKAGCEVYDGAYSWVLEGVKPITPFAVKGQLNLYEVAVPEEGDDGCR